MKLRAIISLLAIVLGVLFVGRQNAIYNVKTDYLKVAPSMCESGFTEYCGATWENIHVLSIDEDGYEVEIRD